MHIRAYKPDDLPEMCRIWNEVVEAGDAFPQEECLTAESGAAFFAAQTYTGVALDEGGEVVGLYIRRPQIGGNQGCAVDFDVR